MNKKVKAIIKTMLDDAQSTDLQRRAEVQRLLKNHTFLTLMITADFPKGLTIEILDGLEMSYIQRQVYYRELWNRIKKIPTD